MNYHWGPSLPNAPGRDELREDTSLEAKKRGRLTKREPSPWAGERVPKIMEGRKCSKTNLFTPNVKRKKGQAKNSVIGMAFITLPSKRNIFLILIIFVTVTTIIALLTQLQRKMFFTYVDIKNNVKVA